MARGECMHRLVVVSGAEVGVEFPLGDVAMIGRDPRCHIHVSSPEVSGHHARLIRVGEGYLVEDLQSRNHTFVNDEQVARRRLHDGDLLRVGRTVFRYRAGEALSAASLDLSDATVSAQIDATRDLLFETGGKDPATELSRRLRLLVELVQILGESRGVKTTLDRIGGLLLELFPQAASVTVLLAQGEGLVPMTALSRDHQVREHAFSETIARRVLLDRRGILTVDALADDRFAAARSVVDLSLRSVMCAPILYDGEPLGVIELDTVSSPRMFTEDDLSLFTAMGVQIGASVANARLHDELQGLVLSSVSALSGAMDARPDAHTGHGAGVARVALSLGRRLDLDGAALEDLRLAALLHDIGALSIPEAILQKAGPLSEGEWEVVRTHPGRSVEVLEPVRQYQRLLPIIRAHHERWDGTGYPDGLKGEAIPLLARVLAVADAFDALTAPRPWRSAQAADEALQEIRRHAGSRFDPRVVEPLERLVRSWERARSRRREPDESP